MRGSKTTKPMQRHEHHQKRRKIVNNYPVCIAIIIHCELFITAIAKAKAKPKAFSIEMFR